MIRHILRRTLVPSLIVAIAVALGISSFAPPASAHSGSQTYLYLDVTPRTLGGRLEIPYADLAATLELDFGSSDEEVLAGLAANKPAIDADLEQHVVIGDGEITWPITFDVATLFYSDLAEQNRGQPTDVKAMAVTIWSNFDNLSIEEIGAKVKDVWRFRNLDWVE